MDKPIRIQRKRTKGWRMPENTVYVGRPTKYGNPYKVGEPHPVLGRPMSREEAVDWFELALSEYYPGCDVDLMAAELRGKNLCCWCPLEQPCHADVLLELANR